MLEDGKAQAIQQFKLVRLDSGAADSETPPQFAAATTRSARRRGTMSGCLASSSTIEWGRWKRSACGIR